MATKTYTTHDLADDQFLTIRRDRDYGLHWRIKTPKRSGSGFRISLRRETSFITLDYLLDDPDWRGDVVGSLISNVIIDFIRSQM